MLYDEIIRNRQAEIFGDIQDLDHQINQLQAAIEKAKATKEFRVAEYNMLQNINDRGLIDDGKKTSRLDFEDTMKLIFEQAGKPMSISQMISKLEEFGYMYSSYQSAWYRLKSTKMLEHTGARGYYNLLR